MLALANKCPIKNGTIIYAVRNLYNVLTKEIHRFEDNCDGNGQARGIKPEGGMIRLKQPKAKESITTNANKVLLYPNPAKTNVTVTSKGIRQVEIFDIMGKKVMVKELNNVDNLNIDISKLNKGLFLVRVNGANGKVSNSKLLIE